MLCLRHRLASVQLTVLALTILVTVASAEIPQKINYQGRLSDASNGEPVEGSQEMIFRIFDSAEDGAELWSETATVTVDSSGVFSALLGSINPIDASFDGPVWLEVEVGGEVLSPRREVVSVPFAFSALSADHAANSDSLGGHTADAFADTSHKHHRLSGPDGSPAAAVYVGEGGDVGIGTSSPEEKLQVEGVVYSATGGFKFPDGSIQTTAITSVPTGGGWVDDGGVIRLEDASDSVGVGTDMPVEKLDVAGTVRVEGFLMPDDSVLGHVLTANSGGSGTWQAPVADGHSLDGSGGVPVDAVYVDAIGKVGIGTTSPDAKLHLYDDSNSATRIIIENPSTGESSSESVIFADENGEAAGITLTDDGYAPFPRQMHIFNNRPQGSMTFSTDDTPRMSISNNGFVGIGTVNPFQKLHVVGDPVVWLRVDATGTDGIAGLGLSNDANSWEIDVRGDLDDAFVIRDNTPGIERMVIDDDGKVGIGTTSPARQLQVHKSAAVSCDLAITNGATGSTSSDGLRLGVNNFREAFVISEEDMALNLGSNGTTDLTIASDGDIGVGTTGPRSPLHIHRNSAAASELRFTNGTSGSTQSDGLVIGMTGPGVAQITNSENTNLTFSTNGTERLWIAPSGRVGIGESTPTNLLTLKGYDPYVDINTTHDKTGFRLQKNGAVKWEVAWNEGSAYMYFWSGGGAGTSVVVEDATGDMGVGTSAPTSKIHVNGAHGYSQLRLEDTYTPAGTSDTNGNTGDIAWDNNYIYVKTGAGWKRASLSTW